MNSEVDGRTDENAVQVDVIILSWNRVEYTIAAVESASTQRGVVKRILVVDQGSDAENLAILERSLAVVANVSLHKLGRNVGVASGRNIATAMGSAPYIVSLDNDAVFGDENMLARAVSHLDADPRLCAIGFRILNFFTGQNDTPSWDYPGHCSPDARFLTSRFIGAGHAIRRGVFEAVGGYDDCLFFCGEEIDVCYRMLNAGYRIEYYPDVMVLHKTSIEHRVDWNTGRYYFSVRNGLYSSYKFGTPLPRLIIAAAAFLAKGFYNRIPSEAIRAITDAFAMCGDFNRSDCDKSIYRLSAETWRYILDCEPSRADSLVTKIQRQLRKLPN